MSSEGFQAPTAEPAPREEAGESADESAAGVPDWFGESVRNVRSELALFWRTAVKVTLRPSRFGAAWASGRQRTLNPLAFMGLSLGVVVPSTAVLERVLWPSLDRALWLSLCEPLLPYVSYVLAGLVAHGLLWAFGSRRPLAGSLGLVLYASAGPVALVGLLLLPPVLWGMARLWGDPSLARDATLLLATSGASFLMLVAGVGWTAAVLGGLHRSRWLTRLVAVLLGYIAATVVIQPLVPEELQYRAMNDRIERLHPPAAREQAPDEAPAAAAALEGETAPGVSEPEASATPGSEASSGEPPDGAAVRDPPAPRPPDPASTQASPLHRALPGGGR